MNDMRSQIELRLRGELLRDWCRQLSETDESVQFDDGWCSGQRVIRFYTSTLDTLVRGWRGAGDCWGLGRLAFYEIENDANRAVLRLTASIKGMRKPVRESLERVLDGEIESSAEAGDRMVLRAWSLADGTVDANSVVASLDTVWREQVIPFERSMVARINGRKGLRQKVHPSDETPRAQLDASLIEGAEYATLANRFERNKRARALCIEAHGAVCAVCGFDFGKAYGREFEGTIDVHHKVPLYEIREGYEVDPVSDLVPLCPNCHRAIHSKPGGGVYTVEELRCRREGALYVLTYQRGKPH